MSIRGTVPGGVRGVPFSSAHPLISWCLRRSGGMRRRISEVIQSAGKSFERNTEMGFFSSSTPEQDAAKAERDISREQHRAYRLAGNQAAKAHRDNHVVHDQLTEAVADAEQHVSWWRR